MEISIRSLGSSYGIILRKSVLKKYSLKKGDILILDDNSHELLLRKKETCVDNFFNALPINADAYGGNTEKYLERLEAPEDE